MVVEIDAFEEPEQHSLFWRSASVLYWLLLSLRVYGSVLSFKGKDTSDVCSNGSVNVIHTDEQAFASAIMIRKPAALFGM